MVFSMMVSMSVARPGDEICSNGDRAIDFRICGVSDTAGKVFGVA